jgi:hypothetical protein
MQVFLAYLVDRIPKFLSVKTKNKGSPMRVTSFALDELKSINLYQELEVFRFSN